MNEKNIALIISEAKNFVEFYSKLLKDNDFKILKAKNLNTWLHKTEASRQVEFDICFVDNRLGGFQFGALLKHLKQYKPQAIVVNVSQNHHYEPPEYIQFFNLNSPTNSIDAESFIQYLAELFKQAKSRTELAALLIHDIRSPINSLLAYIELLLNQTFGELNEGQQSFLEKAMILGDHLLDILEDINEIYRSEQSVFTLNKEPFSPNKVIDEALVNLWAQADVKDIQIKKNVPKKLPQLEGDAFQIQRVFTNLIQNSIKYSPQNSTIIIHVDTSSNRNIKFLIMDNGGGIPEELISKIFRKSYRGKQDSQLRKGEGLGLYICKMIVKAHGGTIQAENNDLGGMSFTFTLPLKK